MAVMGRAAAGGWHVCQSSSGNSNIGHQGAAYVDEGQQLVQQ